MRSESWKARGSGRRPLLALLLGLAAGALAALALPGALDAQGVRGTAVTNVRYLTLRPIEMDTVALADVLFGDDGATTFGGHPVYCLPGGGDCVRYRSADVAHGVVATQDLSATAWGLGMHGLSATVLLRARADLSDGEFAWPGSDDDFDAILAYAQLQRDFVRVRVGRQRTLSGLGFSGFDGAELALDPARWVRVEAYGGRSLARGLSEPRHEALQGIESFVLDQDAQLVGAFVGLSPLRGTSVGARYQREIWADHDGLISERASLDVRSDLPGSLRMDGSIDYDWAFDRVGKAHLTLQSGLPGEWGWVELTGRRYVPYFELSTIWGYFSPTPYEEAEVEVSVVRYAPLTLWASAGWREYGDPEISVIGPPITDRSERYAVGARWSEGPWLATGEYRLETGFGAFLSSGDANVRWAPAAGWSLMARASAFQQIEQFRVGENMVLGMGVGGTAELPWRARLNAGADLYHQEYENRPGQADWNQLRMYTILSVPFGSDPGMGRRR